MQHCYRFAEYLEDPYLDFDEDEIRDRKKIFKEIMDNDGDGKVDRRELIAYLGMLHKYLILSDISRRKR